ncbi:MAG: CBS domain-containing protein [Proteobacteria bacterium]|nr:CBS domain-containing protein [Pseudomonadota bacterium]
MFREYASLGFVPLQSVSGARVARVKQPDRVTLDSAAVLAMTDFTRIPAATVEPGTSIVAAQDYMRRRGVRALLVTDPGGGVAGILTSTDLLGEKPVKFALDYGRTHAEIRVSDLMTERALLELLVYEEVRQSRVGHIVATLRKAGRQHLLVGEQGAEGERVRGIFSLSQIARQLGIDLQPTSFAHTFAEIETALRD